MTEGSGMVRGPVERTLSVLIAGERPGIQPVASRVDAVTDAFDVASEGYEGTIGRLGDEAIDCVVLSRAPNGEAIDLIERLREVAPGIPVVVLVEEKATVDLERAVRAGVTDVLEEPRERVEVTLFARKLEQYAAGYRARTARRGAWAEEQFRAIFEHSPNMISIHDEQGVIHNVNRRTCEKLGYDREELIGMNVSDIEVRGDAGELEEFWQEYEYGEPVVVEGVNRRKDGTEFPVRVNLGRIDLKGEDLILAMLQDVREEKARERELERYERIVENVPVGVYRLKRDPGGTFEFVNPAMVSMFDCDSEDQLTARSFRDLCVDPDACDRFQERILEGEPIVSEEFELRTFDGERIWCAVTAIETVEDGDVYYDGVIQNVTERKEAETRLEASEAHLKQAQSVADVGSWYRDVPSDELRWSEEVYSIFGLSKSEGSLDHERFIACVHPDDREFVERKWTAALEGEPYDIEHRVVADGETRWVREKGEIVFDEDGEPLRAIGVVHDVTERKEYERRLEIHNEQLEVLNRIVRHDIRNHMNVVEGYATILADSLDGERELMAERISGSARKLLSISEKIREVSRLIAEEPEREPLDVTACLEDLLERFEAEYPEGTWTASLPEELWARGTVQLEVALENVLENAIEHNDVPSPEVVVSAAEDRERGEVKLEISDNGPGIPRAEYELLTGERDRSQIEHASGLGLWATNWIVADVGGDLEFESNGSRGTTVTVRLPGVDRSC